MSTPVTVLASGAQSASGSSTPVDVSANSAPMRLDLTHLADMGQLSAPHLDIYVESAPTADGPFVELAHIHLDSRNWRNSSRLILASFDASIRLRWAGASAAGFTLSCTGSTP